MTIRGQVVRLEPAQGFGFIRDDQDGDWFFVASGVRDGRFPVLWVGERVAFDEEWTANGPRATDVRDEQAE